MMTIAHSVMQNIASDSREGIILQVIAVEITLKRKFLERNKIKNNEINVEMLDMK